MINSSKIRFYLTLFFCAARPFVLDSQAAPVARSARLIVQRAPNFGSDLFIRLTIDGKRVADIPQSQHYGGYLSPGRHLVSALALPNTQLRRPTFLRLNVQSGKVYIFTGTWQFDQLVLVPSNYYMPTTRVGEAKGKR